MSAVQPAIRGAKRDIVAIEARRDGVVIVRLEADTAHCGPMTPGFGAELAAAMDRIEQDAGIAAAVLAVGDLDGGTLGADVELLKAIQFATDAERLARNAAHVLSRVQRLKKPMVAAVHGAALGGIFELALACHALVASDDERTVLGFPEASLGLMPAANGMLRAAERAGLRVAIELGLGQKNLSAEMARARGLVDDVCAGAILLEVAARKARQLVGHGRPLHFERGDVMERVLEKNPVFRALVLGKARASSRARTRDHYPAPKRMLDVLERYAKKGFDAAAELEANAFGGLVVSETAHRLIEIHCATTTLNQDSGREHPDGGRQVERVGIVGGGLVGSGVAYVTVRAGASVRLKETDDAAACRALGAVRQLVDASDADGDASSLERDHVLSRLSATSDYSGLHHADLVLEAVFEDLALKQQIVRDVEALVPPTCVLASTTSSIPIAKIARAAKRPERVVGMHYFSPVPKMRLLEVVRADAAQAWAIETAVALGRRQKKTVIVVRDAPGFYTTRILAPFVHEALELLGEGVPIEAIDEAMTDWGFPVGPLQLLDEVGIDVGARVGQLLHSELGERMAPPWTIARLVADERMGRKNRRGLYRYEARQRSRDGRRAVDAGVYAVLGVGPKTALPIEEIQMRCAIAMTNEAVRCLGEGIVGSARDGDVGAVLGLGFPPFRGGPFRYVDTIGAADALRRVQGFADRFGERWRPAPLLVHKARKGERFYG